MRPTHSALPDPQYSRSRFAGHRRVVNRRRNGSRVVASLASGSAIVTPLSSRASESPTASLERPAPERSVPEQLARETARTPSAKRGGEAVTRGVLVAVRAAMGLMLFGCGLAGVLGLAHAHGNHVQQGVMAFGGALLLTGALLPLLKGTEVIVETVLDLQRVLGARREADG